MDHRDFIKSLTAEQRRALTAKSNAEGFKALAMHGRCPLVANAFENTRTTFTNRLIRRLAWNMPYHSEHHAYPMVPFFRLHELHKMVQGYLAVTEQGYIRFNRQYVGELEP